MPAIFIFVALSCDKITFGRNFNDGHRSPQVASGAHSGSFWGLLIGVLFLNLILGAALGAAGGALGAGLTDFGINDEFMKKLAGSIDPGDAALFVLIREMTADKVLEQNKDYGGVVLKTSLADAREQNRRFAMLLPVQRLPKRHSRAPRLDEAMALRLQN